MVELKTAQLDRVFGALADPTRRAILQKLAHRERSVTQIAEPFAMSLAAVSKHLKVLERARLIERKKQGNFYYVRLNAKALKEANRWIEHYRQFWDERLDSLKQFLEQEQK